MNLSPTVTQLIQNGEGYNVVLAVYELVRRHTGMINPSRKDPSIKWALTTAQDIARNAHLNTRNPAGASAEMESCICVMAAALPSDYQDLWILKDEDTVRELSRMAFDKNVKLQRLC